MIDHVSVGVADIARSRKFYDAALQPLGYRCLSESEDSLGYGAETAALWLLKVAQPVAEDEKSGLHFCIVAPTRKSVEAFYKAAVRTGGRDNGPPGLRTDYGRDYFAAFVIDPDGYRIEAYCNQPA